MIPDFDGRGYLPPGIHAATIAEVGRRYRRFNQRSRITDELLEHVEFLQSISIQMFLNGGYVSSRLATKDADILLILPREFDFDGYEGRALARLREQFDRGRLLLDIWPYREGVDERFIQSRMEDWTHDEDGEPKGIILLQEERE